MRRAVLVQGPLRLAAFFALWLLLVDHPDVPDILTGIGCALLATVLATMVQSLRSVHARIEPGMLRHAYRPLWLLVADTPCVARALAERGLFRRPVAGRWRAIRYRATTDRSDDVARRILTEWAASVGPNRYAVGIDRDRGLLLVHELTGSSSRLDPLELG